MRATSTPLSRAMSVSWKVARMARPRRVFWMKRCAPTMSATATAPAKTRIATTWMGPRVSGTGENGCLMVLGDGSQMRIAAFWMMTDSATMASMGISMGWSRSRLRINRSTIAPTSATPATASRRETTAGARSGARREWCREEGHRLLGGRQLPQLRAWRDGDDGVLAVLDLRHDDVAVALPVLVELVEAVEAPGLERLERRH